LASLESIVDELKKCEVWWSANYGNGRNQSKRYYIFCWIGYWDNSCCRKCLSK
jgi:hypothetical protein